MRPPMPARSLVTSVAALTLLLTAPAWPQDGDATKPEETAEPAEPTALAFGDDLDAARAAAKASGKPLLVVAVPDWYESPAWERLEKEILADTAARAPLEGFERVLVKESQDREVHVRHRVQARGYPLAIVLGADGSFLGARSGLPGGEAKQWPKTLAAIPGRAKRIAELRTALDAAEEPGTLFELGSLLVEAGEGARADAVFERYERAADNPPAKRLGEARYQRLRHAVLDLLEKRSFTSVESLCLKWRRRFADHDRAAAVLLLQANARFLGGNEPGARELWERLEKDHEKSPEAATAKKALTDLTD